MQGVGPGTVLGGRYVLRYRLTQSQDLEGWSARDATLQRVVTVTIIGSEHPHGAGLLDAARRAAGVEDARLVRIFDVGTQGDSSFIVEEAVSGAESLTTMLQQGPLPAEEARRIAGEAAKGLEAAGVRGLHHLRLTPDRVLIAPDNSIRVSGVAVAAATDGPDEQEPDSAMALRRDALSLVAILYASLTGRWPLDEEVPGFEPAPRVVAGVVLPSEIVSGVPGDLDALCRMTLNDGAGPLTPGVVARRIAPWSGERVHLAGADPTGDVPVPSTGGVGDGVPAILPAIVPVITGGLEPTVAIPAHDMAAQNPSGGPSRSAPQPSAMAPPAVNKASAAGAATTKVLGTALAGAGAAAGAVGGKLTSLARAAGEKSARTDSGRAAEQTTMPVGLRSGDDIGPPLPLLPASTALPPTRRQSKIVLLVMAAFVAVALFFGYRGLVGPISGISLSKPTPTRTVVVSAPAVTVPASPAPQAASTAAGPIAILSATGFDPQGDGKESSDWAPRVYDGDLATSWSSELYQTAQFGNLKKGVGVILDLGQPTSVHKVAIDLGNGPVDLTVYAATSQSLTGATEIGAASGANGHLEIKAASTMPEAQYVIVWFTALAQDGSQFRASIKEIALN